MQKRSRVKTKRAPAVKAGARELFAIVKVVAYYMSLETCIDHKKGPSRIVGQEVNSGEGVVG
ncbi:MAG: hypothetical protein ACI8PG_004599 [Planctomycetota bacterium]|jgi:hypothetical protein